MIIYLFIISNIDNEDPIFFIFSFWCELFSTDVFLCFYIILVKMLVQWIDEWIYSTLVKMILSLAALHHVYLMCWYNYILYCCRILSTYMSIYCTYVYEPRNNRLVFRSSLAYELLINFIQLMINFVFSILINLLFEKKKKKSWQRYRFDLIYLK